MKLDSLDHVLKNKTKEKDIKNWNGQWLLSKYKNSLLQLTCFGHIEQLYSFPKPDGLKF